MNGSSGIVEIWNRIENWFAVIGLLVTAIIVFVNVITRYIFSFVFPWSEELVRYIMIWVTFIGMDIGVRESSHLGVEFFVGLLGKRSEAIVRAIVCIASAFFALSFAYLGSTLLLSVFRTAQLSPALYVPMWIFYLIIPIGGLTTGIRYIILSSKFWRRAVAGPDLASGR